MKLDGRGIGGSHLELDFSGDAGTRTVTLRDVAELGGGLAIGPGAIELRGVELAGLTIAGVHWTAGSTVLAVETPARARGLELDLAIARRAAREAGAPLLRGTARIEALAAGRMSIEARGRRVTFGLELDGVVFEGGDDGGVRVVAERAVVRELQAPAGGAIARVPQLELREVVLAIADGSARITCSAARAGSVTLAGERFSLTVSGLELPHGLSADRGGIQLDTAGAELLELSVDPLVRARAAGDDSAAPAAPPADKKPLPIDLRVLDQLSGQADVDLGVDVTVPVIGRRKATHRFRIALESGTLDFKELEDDLASLEDAFIDFEVDDDQLILRRKIPLIPGTSKPILIWDLEDAVEMELARRKRVRLRRLRAFRTPGDQKDKQRKSEGGSRAVELRQLAARNIDLRLSMSSEAAAVDLDGASHDLAGWLQRADLGELRVTGALEHDPGREPAPGTLSIAGRELELDLAGIPLGRARLERLGISISRIEGASLVFAGLRPRALEARLAGVALADLSVTLES